MEKPREDIVELIRKCLALSTSPNEYEAALALSKAQELLEKYNLQMREIQDLTPDQFPTLINYALNFDKKLPEWKIHLIHYVAMNNLCKVVTSAPKVHILGTGMNISAVLEMSLWVIDQLELLAAIHASAYQGSDPKLTYRNAFLWSAINTIHQRLKESQQSRMDTNGPTKALVVTSKGELKRFAYEQFGPLHSRPHNIRYSHDGQRDGAEVAKNVSLYGPGRQTYGASLPPGGE